MPKTPSRRQFILTAACATAFVPSMAMSAPRQQVFLTYDDGPDPRHTPMLLDFLGVYGMRATFFLMGSKAAKHPELVARIARSGHAIGNHSWSHPDLHAESDARILDEIDSTNDVLARITGRMPTLFRPPYGAFTPAQTQMIRDTRGMRTALWDLDTLDWQKPGVAEIQRRVLGGLRPGRVVLMHDVHADTVAAAPEIFAGMIRAGYVSTTIG